MFWLICMGGCLGIKRLNAVMQTSLYMDGVNSIIVQTPL